MLRGAGLLCLGLLACRAEAPQSPPPLPSVRSAPVVLRQDPQVIQASGTVAGAEQFDLSFENGGRLVRLTVAEGDQVRAGQPLALLDPGPARARLERAAAALERARRDLEAAQQLLAARAAPPQEPQDAGTTLAMARSDSQLAALALEQTVVRAPQAGLILARRLMAGQVASPGQPVFSFAGQGWVLRAAVTEREAVLLAAGDSASVQLDAFPGKFLAATLSRPPVTPLPPGGMYLAELVLRDPPPRLLPGMLGQATLFTGREESLPAIPVEALIEANAERGYVYVLQQGQVHKRPVILAGIRGGQALVRAGVVAGEQVITEGMAYLRDRSAVQVAGQPER
ncbi:MAG: efflux RND transporter periplasmic adaptor subunit [Candidatus Latescibacteria bacterium]|nr:efflux RND transporter periplasmic adaptor subunit [Candidatus Latescibacterota bacterium]